MHQPAEVIGIDRALHQDEIAAAEKRVEEIGGVLNGCKGMQALSRLRRLGTSGMRRHRPDAEDVIGPTSRRSGCAGIHTCRGSSAVTTTAPRVGTEWLSPDTSQRPAYP